MPETILTRDEMLDIITSYWLTNTATSSARLYWETAHEAREPVEVVTLPSAFSLFPQELGGSSRRWAEKRFKNIVYWNEPERGGHFAALEQPDSFVQELQHGIQAILSHASADSSQ